MADRKKGPTGSTRADWAGGKIDGKMGGKSPEHWDGVMRQIIKLVVRVDRAREMMLQTPDPSWEDATQEAAADIDALLDALVVLDFEYEQHFGERPPCMKRKGPQAKVLQ